MSLPSKSFVCLCNEVTAEQLLAAGPDYFVATRVTLATRKCGSCAPKVLKTLTEGTKSNTTVTSVDNPLTSTNVNFPHRPDNQKAADDKEK